MRIQIFILGFKGLSTYLCWYGIFSLIPIINQRKTIVNSWVRCLENNQLVITSGFPTVILENDRNSYYKYTILVLETQYLSCCLLHLVTVI